MKIERTSRGFVFATFTDENGETCSVQDSSSVGGGIWLGLNDVRPIIPAKVARVMGLPTNGQTTGWIDYPMPLQALICGRMHLSREQVAELLPVLQRFVDTGSIEEAP